MTKFLSCAAAFGVAVFCAIPARANVSVTAATGGASLSADKAQNGAVPAFTTLGNIVITEGAVVDFADTGNATNTLILTAPSGWRFNSGTGSVSFAASANINLATISVTTNTITVGVRVNLGNKFDTLTISNIQVQATEGGNLPASGNIVRTGGSATVAGIVNGTTSFGSLSQSNGALRLYVVLPGQSFTDAVTVATSGTTGAASDQTAGSAFNISKLIAADRQFNISSAYSGAKTISYTGPTGIPSYTTAVSFSSGQSTTTLATTLTKAETTTITATDGTVAGVASSSLKINAAPFTKLQLLVPGESVLPGTASGKTGTPSARTVGVAFNVTVNAVDANWNLTTNVTDTARILSSDANATLPANAALATGTQTFNVSLNTAGTQTLTATNISNSSILANTSPPISVNKTSTTTMVTSSVNPAVFGQSVTFTATVTQASGTVAPTGTVTFKDGATTLGTGALSSGLATFTISSLSVSNHTISAVYPGDGNYNTSTSVNFTQTVNKAGTSTGVASSVNPSVFGQSVTFTATVTATAPGAGTPTGTVTFKDGATTLGNGTLTAGQATFITSSLATGSHPSITATYNSAANFTGSTSPDFAQTVNQASTTTTLASSVNPSVFGQSVTFTATVSQASATGTVTFNVDGTDQPPASVDAAGHATVTVSGLSIGNHTITATYSGDGNFAGSASTNFTQTVTTAASATTVISSQNPSVFGDSVTFTATLSGSFGTPTGSATFKDGVTTLGSAALDGSGQATFTTNSLTGGMHSITAEYGGDSLYTGSTSAVLTQTVTQAASATIVVSSLDPSVYGESVTFTATVSSVAGTPTGTVTFKDDATTLGTGTLVSAEATLTTSTLAAGIHTNITATYSSDVNFSGSISAAITQTVTQADTATTLASSVNPSVFGESVTFTATVTSATSGTPSGTVDFILDGGLPTNVTLTAGLATLATATLSVGDHTITATYNGDHNFTGSASADFTQTVVMASSVTTVSSSLNPSLYGQSVTFTGTVSAVAPGAGTPTGLLTFDVDGVSQAPVVINAGIGTVLVTGLSTGLHTVAATYGGDGNFTGNTSADFTQTVNKGNTAATIASSLNPSVFGDAVTFTATVVGAGDTPTGTVTFKDGATTMGTGALISGEATLLTSSLSAGNHTISVVYGGDGNYNASTSTNITQTVNQASSSTDVTSAPNPSVFGQAVTFTATVNPAGTTGTVTFKDGATTLGTGTLAGGLASFTTNSLATGSHPAITATYNGDANFTGSTSADYAHTVNRADTTTTIASSANPSVFGQPVVFTATITPVAPGAGTRTGTATFTIDSAPQTPVSLNASGQAALTNSSLTVGTHTVSVAYSGDANFNGSASSDLTQTVNRAGTTTAVSSSINPSLFGQSVTFTGTVSVVAPGAGTRTGTLTFSVDSVAQAPVAINASGIGTLLVSGLSTGLHTVAATYSGDGNFTGSTSTDFTQTVSKGSATTTVSSSVNPSVFGQSVTFTAAVTQVSGLVTPTGTVTFKDGATTLGTGALSSGLATFAISSLSVSNHIISAVYGGDGNFNTSTSTNFTQVVNKASTTTALGSSVTPICSGQPVTFTATVSAVVPGVGTPTGTVTFRDGGTTLGAPTLSAGLATFTTSTLATGTRLITATYNGSSNFNTSVSLTFTQTVNALPVCSITGTNTMCAGTSALFYTPLAGLGAYSWSITGNGTITGATDGQSVNVDAGASGSFTLNLLLTGTNTCTSTCSQTVTINTSTIITGNPTNRTVCAGNSATFTVSSTGSPTPTIQWQASSNGGATFTNIAGATSSTYSFTANLSQNGNQYRVLFGNACGSTLTTTVATLTVNPLPDATITADSIVCASSTGNIASVPDAGAGASYTWSVSGGTITAGAGTRSITYTAGNGSITLNVTVTNSFGCPTSSSKSVSIASASNAFAAWRNKPAIQWQSSTFNSGDHKYSDGNSIPFRVELNQQCGGGGWCVVLRYDFKDNNTARHFFDFLSTYNSSESTVNGQECTNHVCSGVPTTFPIPVDTNLTYQLPGNFTVYNGTITNASVYTTVTVSGQVEKELTIRGTTDPGSVRDVLILFGGHLARENEWGTGHGAHDFPGASAKMFYKLCSDSSFNNFSVNPSGIIPQSDLAIFKTDSPDPVCPGGLLTYTITVTNTGPDQATSVTVVDPLPLKTTLFSAVPSQGTFTGTTNLNFNIGAINAGTNATITVVVNVATNAPATITNTATVSLAAPADPFLANNSATAVTTLRAPPSCLISGPSSVCPASSTNFTGPAGMTSYGWSITGNGSIAGATNAQTVTVTTTTPGSFTIYLGVTDTNGCVSSTCQMNVAVVNAGTPLLTCVDDKFLQCGESTTTNNTGRATASDACGGGSVTLTFTDVATPANCTGRAGINRIWTATNSGGQSAICTQHIIFVDSTAPLISCPPDKNVTTDAGLCTASNVALGAPVFSDNCSAVTVSNNAPAVYPKGVTTVTWTATDACGNFATCAQTVTVTDNQAPGITCPGAVSRSTDAGQCFATLVPLGSPVTSDNCSGLTVSNDAPAQFPVGTTTVHWTVTDGAGLTGTCSQSVTINDTELPTILCPSDVVAQIPFAGCTLSNIDLGTPVTSDNCGVATVTNNAPAVFGAGVTNVIWTVTDVHGNAATCIQTVRVMDSELPTISCPPSITTNAGPGVCSLTNLDLGTPLISDNCGISSIASNAPTVYPIGTTLITWTVTDLGGNSNTCVQSVTVIATRDFSVPCYVVRDYDPVTTFIGCNPATGTGEHLWSGQLTFNSDQWDTLGERESFLNTGNMQMDQDANLRYEGCLRQLTVYFTNPDDATYGNILWSGLESDSGTSVYLKSGGCATVEQVILDPCPQNGCLQSTITFTNMLAVSCRQTVSYCGTASNACSTCVFSTQDVLPGNLVLTQDGCVTGRVACVAAGSYTNTITIICGQATNNQQLVFEVICPEFSTCTNSPVAIVCPPDLTNQCLGAVGLGNPSTTGGCGAVSITNNAPASFTAGSNQVIWTAMDGCGNSAICTQLVVVREPVAPTFAGLVSATAGIGGATLSWQAASTGNMTYSVYQANISGAEDFNAPVLTTANLETFVAPLTPGITYFFVVRATDVCGMTELNTVERAVQPLPDPATDTDGDGMPDSFELQHGFNPSDPGDAARDADGDGLSNLEEYLAGTDPTDSASYFGITRSAREENGIRITWTTGIGRTNALQRTSSGTRNFTNDFTEIFVVTNAVDISTNYLDTGAVDLPAFYYRVRLVP